MQLENNNELSSHRSGDSDYRHCAETSTKNVLAIAVCLTMGFAFVEVVGGFLSNSLALLSDAGHMLTDSCSLFFALIAGILARRPASSRFSYGLAKTEVIAAMINALLMFLVVAWIVYEAVGRLTNPQPVAGGSVFIVAVIGLIVNIIVAYTLSKDSNNLNTRAALLHVMGDLLGSVAAIIAGIVIYFGGSTIVDPILSVFVSMLILKSSYSVFKRSIHLLLDAVPDGLSFEQVGNTIKQVLGVDHVHDLHIWEMSDGHTALSAHVTLKNLSDWPKVLRDIRSELSDKFKITHVTLQPEVE